MIGAPSRSCDASRSPARGFSLLELAVVLIAAALLAGVVLERVLPLIGRAQRIAFVRVRHDLEAALRLEAADRIARGDADQLAALASTNPMDLVLEPPANYVGALDAPEPDRLPGNVWYYDERAGTLVYRVGAHARFAARGGPANRIAFKVALVFDDRDGDARFDASLDRLQSLRLAALDAYAWPE